MVMARALVDPIMPRPKLWVTLLVASSLVMAQLAHAYELVDPNLGQPGTCLVPSKCPKKAPKVRLLDKTCKYLIVGGGTGGLMAAYQLRAKGAEVCVLEKEEVWGGRMQDYPAPDPDPNDAFPPAEFGSCGLRVNEAQLDTRCLAYELGVTLQESNFETLIYARGKTVRSIQELVGEGKEFPFNTTSEDLETDLYSYLFLNETNTNPITGQTVAVNPEVTCGKYATVESYIRAVVGSDAYDFLYTGNSFRVDFLKPLDVCAYIEYFKTDWNRCCSNFYPVGGWEGINNRSRAVSAASGVRFLANTEVTCLYQNTAGQYVVLTDTNNTAIKGFAVERLILNTPPRFLAAIGGTLGKELNEAKEIKAIVGIETVVFNAFFPERFWQQPSLEYATQAYKNFRVITDKACNTRAEFPGHPYVLSINATRPIYVDDPTCVAQFTALYEMGGDAAVLAAATADLQTMFPDVVLPPSTGHWYFNKDPSWHYLGPNKGQNVTIQSVIDFAKGPLGKSKLCLVAEAYNIRDSGWAQGAHKSAFYCLEQQFADIVPQSQLDYYTTGCNGLGGNGEVKVFPNEVSYPATELFPETLTTLAKSGKARKKYVQRKSRGRGH